MNILESFVTSLPATIERSRINDQIEMTTSFLNEAVIPYLTQSMEFTDISKSFKSKEVKAMVEQFYRMARLPNKGFQKDLTEALTLLVERLGKVRPVVAKSFPKTVARDTLTYRQLGYIQFASAADFVADFSPKLLSYIVRAEICSLTNDRIENHMPKATILEIEEGWLRYIQVIRITSTKASTILEDLEKAADLLVEAGKMQVMAATHGDAKINPMASGFLPPRYNPFRIFGMAMAEYQAKRYHQLQEQLSLFQVLLAYQKQLLENEVDPAVERRVEELSGIVEELQARLNKLEKRYG